jgi:hypothetical protein
MSLELKLVTVAVVAVMAYAVSYFAYKALVAAFMVPFI